MTSVKSADEYSLTNHWRLFLKWIFLMDAPPRSGWFPAFFFFFFFFLRIFREDSSGILLIERLRRLRAKRRIRQWNTSDKQTSSALLCWRVVSAWPRVQRSIGDQWKWGRMECCYQPLSGISSVICDPLSPLCSFHCKFQRAETNGESNIHSTLRHLVIELTMTTKWANKASKQAHRAQIKQVMIKAIIIVSMKWWQTSSGWRRRVTSIGGHQFNSHWFNWLGLDPATIPILLSLAFLCCSQIDNPNAMNGTRWNGQVSQPAPAKHLNNN